MGLDRNRHPGIPNLENNLIINIPKSPAVISPLWGILTFVTPAAQASDRY
jgi:hypothetical protein